MKSVYVLGNWKSNKTLLEATSWVETFFPSQQNIPEDTIVILCPAFHHLPLFLERKLAIFLGAQNVSPYQSGPYTGEISALMLDAMVTYAMIGHSERRTHFHETNEVVVEKVKRCMEHDIKPIVCVSTFEEVKDLSLHVPEFSRVGILLYELPSAIGTGKADSPENANNIAIQFKQLFDIPILYGGSVKPENVKEFVSQEHIDGVVVGGASLDAQTFISLIQNASLTVLH